MEGLKISLYMCNSESFFYINIACELLVKMKTLQNSNQQSRKTSFNVVEMGIYENKHDPKFISALEEWCLKKVCYL
jgi:hypothetical protein